MERQDKMQVRGLGKDSKADADVNIIVHEHAITVL